MTLSNIRPIVGLGTATVRPGGSNLLNDQASIFSSNFRRTYAQKTRHILGRKPTKRASGGERRYSVLAAIQYYDATDWVNQCPEPRIAFLGNSILMDGGSSAGGTTQYR